MEITLILFKPFFIFFYDYHANASEGDEKITADEKDYHKCSF